MDIQNKVAIITGASSGIGLATAKLLSENGAKVALIARSKDKLEKLSGKLKDSYVVQADLSKENEVRQMIKKVSKHYGQIDILINNAGVGYDASIEHTEIAKLHHIIDLDFLGPYVAMQEVIPIMRKLGGGVIVNISSGTALMALPNMSGYSSLKRAIAGVSLTAREELKKDNISVSVIYPFITLTDFEKNTLKSGDQFEYSGGGDIPKGDPPEFIAEKIVNVIKTGEAEVYAHDWMKKRN